MCEFITGGGLCNEVLPESLLKEGALMRDSLLRDLSELGCEISTTVDARVKSPPHYAEYITIKAEDDVWQIWQAHIKAADAVFLIAPESDNLLYDLTRLATLQGRLVLGCGLAVIALTAKKSATFRALQQAGIATIATYTLDDWPKSKGIWLAKPDAGAGCSDTVCFNQADDLQDWMMQADKKHTHVIQPYQSGEPASISCIIKNGRAQLLSCNTQIIEINDHIVCYKGSVVNGMQQHWQAFESLADQIAGALPDLAGYVGIDVIVDKGAVYVIEINPRFTTSYVGLREAIGVNPAELIINTLTQTDFVWPSLQRNTVGVYV